MSKPSLWRRILSGIWQAITRIRLAMSNILFLVMIALIYFVYIGGTPEPLPEKAALLLNVGARWQVSPLWALEAGFIEDIRVETAPDVTFQASLRFTP